MKTEQNKTILADLNRVAAALRQVKKAKATWAKYRKAEKAGRVTAAQVEAARAVLTESVRDSLEMAFESSLGLGSNFEHGNTASDEIAAELIS